jgi:NADPH:quinone reductase-like Zn-dependent oxidoreductase
VRFEDAAAAALVTVTAWHGLIVRGGLRAGERVLVTGASGGVGSMAVQVAALAGATVYAITSGEANVERVRKLGAQHVLDRAAGDWVKPLKETSQGRGVDVAFDSVGEAVWEAVLRSLAVRGRLVSYGATTGARGVTEIRHLFWKQLSILGSTMGSPADFRRAMGLVFEGRLRPIVHEVLPLEQARRAHELLEAGHVFGKLVLVP